MKRCMTYVGRELRPSRPHYPGMPGKYGQKEETLRSIWSHRIVDGDPDQLVNAALEI
jgi:hypothetical protein